MQPMTVYVPVLLDEMKYVALCAPQRHIFLIDAANDGIRSGAAGRDDGASLVIRRTAGAQEGVLPANGDAAAVVDVLLIAGGEIQPAAGATLDGHVLLVNAAMHHIHSGGTIEDAAPAAPGATTGALEVGDAPSGDSLLIRRREAQHAGRAALNHHVFLVNAAMHFMYARGGAIENTAAGAAATTGALEVGGVSAIHRLLFAHRQAQEARGTPQGQIFLVDAANDGMRASATGPEDDTPLVVGRTAGAQERVLPTNGDAAAIVGVLLIAGGEIQPAAGAAPRAGVLTVNIALHLIGVGCWRPVDAAALEVLRLSASDRGPRIGGFAQRASGAACVLPNRIERPTAGHIHHKRRWYGRCGVIAGENNLNGHQRVKALRGGILPP